MPTLAIAILFILTYAFYVFVVKDPELNYEANIGQNVIELVDSYKKSENDLFYNEQAIKYSLIKATEKFANNGGVKEECNKVWVLNSINCSPNLEDNFEEILKQELTNYNLELQEFSMNDNIINIELSDNTYSSKKRNFEFRYTVKHEFKYDSLIDFGKINALKNSIESCPVDKRINQCLLEGSLEGSNTIYFTIENNKNTFTLSPLPEFKKINFKFGINNENRGEVKF